MISCNNCKTGSETPEDFCPICSFPFTGTEDAQAQFFAQQVISKRYVADSVDRLKKARIILFFTGSYFVILPLIPIFRITSFDMVLHLILGLLFFGFGFLTFRRPKIALLIPLAITAGYYLLQLLIDPVMFFSGIIWKILILAVLGYGYFSIRRSDGILRANPYLASLMGFSKISGK